MYLLSLVVFCHFPACWINGEWRWGRVNKREFVMRRLHFKASMHSSRMHTNRWLTVSKRISGDGGRGSPCRSPLRRQTPPRSQTPPQKSDPLQKADVILVMWPVMHAGKRQTPPNCGQNDRCLWKHNLPPFFVCGR